MVTTMVTENLRQPCAINCLSPLSPQNFFATEQNLVIRTRTTASQHAPAMGACVFPLLTGVQSTIVVTMVTSDKKRHHGAEIPVTTVVTIDAPHVVTTRRVISRPAITGGPLMLIELHCRACGKPYTPTADDIRQG